MGAVTYFVVQPFEITDRGLVVAQAREVHGGPDAARAMARRLAAKGGAIAFSRSGDPAVGDFDDAEVLGVYGEVPEDASELAAAAAG